MLSVVSQLRLCARSMLLFIFVIAVNSFFSIHLISVRLASYCAGSHCLFYFACRRFFFLNFFLSNFVEFSANSLFGTNIVVIASCLQNKYKFVTILDEEQIVIAVCTNFGWTDFMREMREK